MNTAVELANTLAPGSSGGRPYAPPSGADRRSVVADLLTPATGRRPRLSEQDVVELADVATRLQLVFGAVDSGHRGIAAGLVNGLLVESGARPQLDQDPVDGWNLHFHGSDDSIVTGWTAGCAAGLALAVGSDLVGRLGVCSARGCDRVYVDDSRNGARRFCSTACQNRTKAAAFRARRTDPTGA